MSIFYYKKLTDGTLVSIIILGRMTMCDSEKRQKRIPAWTVPGSDMEIQK